MNNNMTPAEVTERILTLRESGNTPWAPEKQVRRFREIEMYKENHEQVESSLDFTSD